MWWFHRNKPDQEAAQRQAQKALELSQIQQEIIDEMTPRLETRASLLARLNHENNFGPKLEAAYAQRRP